MHRLLLVVGCGLLSVSVIGCAQSDDVITKADALCRDAQAKQLALLDGSSQNSKDPNVMKDYLKSSLSETFERNNELAHLTPPVDQIRAWKAWLNALNAQEEATQKLIKTVKAGMKKTGHSAYLKALSADITRQIKSNKLADALGLTDCGQNASI